MARVERVLKGRVRKGDRMTYEVMVYRAGDSCPEYDMTTVPGERYRLYLKRDADSGAWVQSAEAVKVKPRNRR